MRFTNGRSPRSPGWSPRSPGWDPCGFLRLKLSHIITGLLLIAAYLWGYQHGITVQKTNHYATNTDLTKDKFTNGIGNNSPLSSETAQLPSEPSSFVSPPPQQSKESSSDGLISSAQNLIFPWIDTKIPKQKEIGSGKDVVVGMAKGIAPKPLAIFLASLRQFSKSSDVVLWVDAKSLSDEKVVSLMERYNVEVRQFDPSTLEPTFTRKWHPSSYRWVLIHQFLSSDEIDSRAYRAVLLADVRDTAFQADPFSIIDERGDGFFASSEDMDVPKRKIRDCGWNSGWISSCYPESTLKQVENNPIICSGMSLATLPEAKAYVKLMYEKLVSHSGRQCERNGVDQGMHNVLVWTNQISNLHILTQESGPIANMQAELIVVSGDGKNLRVNNKRGQIMPIVHQYDRDMTVLRAFESLHVDWVPDDSKLCKGYNIDDSGVDLFAGRCDMGLAGGATSKGDCCRACNSWDGCKAFAFSIKDGKCYIKDCNNVGSAKRMTLRGGGSTGWQIT